MVIELLAIGLQVAIAFNLFRIKIVMCYVFCNMTLAALALAYDPTLSHYALGVTATVVFQSCVKVRRASSRRCLESCLPGSHLN
jgi:hypothetical protein